MRLPTISLIELWSPLNDLIAGSEGALAIVDRDAQGCKKLKIPKTCDIGSMTNQPVTTHVVEEEKFDLDDVFLQRLYYSQRFSVRDNVSETKWDPEDESVELTVLRRYARVPSAHVVNPGDITWYNKNTISELLNARLSEDGEILNPQRGVLRNSYESYGLPTDDEDLMLIASLFKRHVEVARQVLNLD